MGFGRYGKKETFDVLSKNSDAGLIVDVIRFHAPQSPSLILFSACSSSPLIDEAWRWQTVQSCRALSLDCYLLLLELLCSNPMAAPWEAEGWKGWTGWFRTVCPPSSHASQALLFVRWSMWWNWWLFGRGSIMQRVKHQWSSSVGNSACMIQWALGYWEVPWQVTDVVEEVVDLAWSLHALVCEGGSQQFGKVGSKVAWNGYWQLPWSACIP